jgi:hypothetical protein
MNKNQIEFGDEELKKSIEKEIRKLKKQTRLSKRISELEDMSFEISQTKKRKKEKNGECLQDL